MSYTYFPAWYDTLMRHVPYDRWFRLVEEVERERLAPIRSLLDIGCGTGELLLMMYQKGWQPVGVDLSADMLAIAAEKLSGAGVKPQLFEADMSALPPLGQFDVITIFCDALNYLPDEVAVRKTLTHCFAALHRGGVLLFDVHSPTKMRQFQGATFADASEEISYIWQSFAGATPLSVEHELTFFVRDETGAYARFDEVHHERTFLPADYERWLRAAGFDDVEVTADFTTVAPTEKSERLFFKCIKK